MAEKHQTKRHLLTLARTVVLCLVAVTSIATGRAIAQDTLSETQQRELLESALYSTGPQFKEDIEGLTLEELQSVKTSYRQLTLAHYAARNKTGAGAMRVLLSTGFDAETLDENGNTPLYTALRGDKIEIVDVLLDAGADFDRQDRQRFLTSPFEACQLQLLIHPGHAVCLEILQRFGRTNPLPDFERLKKIAENGTAPELRSAIAQIAFNDLAKFTDTRGNTLLHFAAVNKTDSSVIELLISMGIDVNATNDFGGTPVREAFFTKRVKALEALLERGADFSAIRLDDRSVKEHCERALTRNPDHRTCRFIRTYTSEP